MCRLQGIILDECGETVFSMRRAAKWAIDDDVWTPASEHAYAKLVLVTARFGRWIVMWTQGQFRPPLGRFAGPRNAFTPERLPRLDKRRRAAGRRRWDLEVVVRRSGNRFANVPYAALLSETLYVVMWTVVLFVMCLAALFLNTSLLRKEGCNGLMFVWRKCYLNNL